MPGINATPSAKTVHIRHSFFKVLYYLLFSIFVSFFGAYRIKGLFIDWKSFHLELRYILPLIFLLSMCICYFAYKNNFVENLVNGIVGDRGRKLKHVYTYIFMIFISFLTSLFSHGILTDAGAGTISNIIQDNEVRVLSNIGSGFFAVCLYRGIGLFLLSKL